MPKSFSFLTYMLQNSLGVTELIFYVNILGYTDQGKIVVLIVQHWLALQCQSATKHLSLTHYFVVNINFGLCYFVMHKSSNGNMSTYISFLKDFAFDLDKKYLLLLPSNIHEGHKTNSGWYVTQLITNAIWYYILLQYLQVGCKKIGTVRWLFSWL